MATNRGVLELLTETVKLVSWLLSTTPSSTALMVTIWAMFQLLGVKVVGEELISPSGKAMVSATLAVGASLSTKLLDLPTLAGVKSTS